MTIPKHSTVPPLKVAIIIPPIEDFYATPHRMSSLGATIVAKLLERANCSVVTIDGVGNCSKKQQIALPAPLSYLKQHLMPGETGKCSFFGHYYHFGDTVEEIATRVLLYSPQICFISCFAFCYGDSTIALAAEIKKQMPSLPIVAGGAGVSVYPDYFLRNRSIDYTLSGEAETNIAAFVSYFSAADSSGDNVPGLGFKKGDRLCFSSVVEHADSASLTPVIIKTSDTLSTVNLTASLSRGCNSRCRFCANHLVHGRSFRHTHIELFSSLLSEHLPLSSGKKVAINFEDDNLLNDLPFFREVLKQCKTVFPNVSFTAENGLDYRQLTPDLCNELIDSGFTQFNFTLGSVSSSLLSRELRTGSLDEFTNLVTLCNTRSIRVISYCICGFPNETVASLAATLLFLKQLRTTIGISMFYPVPGIPGFTDKKVFDALPPLLSRGSSAYPWSTSLSTDTLVTAFRLARMINCNLDANQSTEERECIATTIATGKLHTIIKEKKTRRIIEVPVQDVELVQRVMIE